MKNDLQKTNSESSKLRIYFKNECSYLWQKYVKIKLLKICSIHINIYINYIDEYGILKQLHFFSKSVITFVERNVLILDFMISDSVRTHMLWMNSEKKILYKACHISVESICNSVWRIAVDFKHTYTLETIMDSLIISVYSEQ